jgi:two-component system response regulator YesN
MSNLLYKIFLVEDEIVAREGIRDTVAWNACGFEFVGEAADGESALPLIQQSAPDLLITDIRMPFMDGLQLSRLVRERLPQTRIVILSGYDEFSYAQAAIALGVSEYILKPVSARDIEKALIAIKEMLDRERLAADERRELASQVENTRALQRRELLVRLCLGDLDPFEALERSHEVGLDIAASAYAVIVARALLSAPHAGNVHPARGPSTTTADPALAPRRLQQLQGAIYTACANMVGVAAFRKDIEEVVVVVMGDDAVQVRARMANVVNRLAHLPATASTETASNAVAAEGVQVLTGVGTVQQRLSDLPLSFATALDALQYEGALIDRTDASIPSSPAGQVAASAPAHLNRQAIERHLRFGARDDFDAFFTDYAAHLDHHALDQRIIRDYLLVDLTMAAADCVRELGGTPASVIPEAAHAADLAINIHTLEELRALAANIFGKVIDFRDSIARRQHRQRLMHARDFIEQHAADADLSLTAVAAHVNVSPSHFSAIFSRETGETFKEFLTRVRMERAQGLLRSTALPIVEIAQRSGFSDPHYFSAAFKRVTGMPPREYRDARPPSSESTLP